MIANNQWAVSRVVDARRLSERRSLRYIIATRLR